MPVSYNTYHCLFDGKADQRYASFLILTKGSVRECVGFHLMKIKSLSSTGTLTRNINFTKVVLK